MKKTFFVQTSHPVIEYKYMLIEAESLDEANEIGERIAGIKPWFAAEASGDEGGFYFSEQFNDFLADTSTHAH